MYCGRLAGSESKEKVHKAPAMRERLAKGFLRMRMPGAAQMS